MKKVVVLAVSVALGLSLALTGCSEKTPDGSGTPSAEVVEDQTGEHTTASDDAEAAAKAEAASLEEEHAAARAAAEEAGLTVFIGTVRVMGGLDLCTYEDVDPNMNGDPEVIEQSTYVVLELDEMTHVVGMGADGSPREGDADHIGIGRYVPAYDFIEDTSTRWADFDGLRVCVAGEPWFQTDVSLPFAPRMYDAQLLYQE